MITHLEKLYNIVITIPFHNADEYLARLSLCGEFNSLMGSLSSNLNKIINTMNYYIDGAINKNDLKNLQEAINSNKSLISVHFVLPVCIGIVSYEKGNKDITDDQYQFLIKFVCKTLNHKFRTVA